MWGSGCARRHFLEELCPRWKKLGGVEWAEYAVWAGIGPRGLSGKRGGDCSMFSEAHPALRTRGLQVAEAETLVPGRK